jgi:SPP1 family predicted phage head-tail adaptor
MVDRRKRPHNRRVTVSQQDTTVAANADGSFPETATTYCTRWCRAWPLKGQEQPAMEHQHATVDWIVQMRKDATTKEINAEMWLTLSTGERLNITSIYDPDGRNRDIEIRARQVA